MHVTDEQKELLEQIAEGDQEAFATFFERQSPRMLQCVGWEPCG